MSTQSQSNNKRIAKNTLFLYIRQLLTMVVSLYTSRVVLNTLGVDDYGIYNVVGGVVAMFGFLTNTMATASQRYLSFDLASNDNYRLRQTFSLIMLSYIILSVVALLLCETIAVWFLNTQMSIPPERLYAANWVLQFSIMTFLVHIMTAPYMSVIIAREKMDVYAYVSIAEVLLKLLVAYMITIATFDKLICYSMFMFVSVVIIAVFYYAYCRRNFAESKYQWYYNKERLVELSSFAGWNILGSIANVLRSHGINLLLNVFFNPAINAARGVAFQVNTAVTQFTNNFYTAVRPQIIKSYASGETQRMFALAFMGSKLAYFLLLILTVPLIAMAQPILELWLKVPPEYSALFVRLVLINSLLEVLSLPLVNMLQAAGNIKKYQLFMSCCYVLVLPISYIFLKLGYPPETAMIVNLCIVGFAFIPRLLFCRNIVGLPILGYAKNVLLPIVFVSGTAILFSFFMNRCFNIESMSINYFVQYLFVVEFATVCSICLIGFKQSERKQILEMILKKNNTTESKTLN